MTNNKKNIDPEKVADSAEKQLLSLKKAQDDKIQEVKQEQHRMVELKRTLSALIYAAGSGYVSVYPQAEGFIEGRIKTLDSIETKTRNEITEILSQIEENPDIDQQEILNKISKIDFKDLFAFSVVTTDTPERFKTGSDEKNAEFTNLSSEITTSKKRIAEHDDFTESNKSQVIKLTNIITNLREKENSAIAEKKKEEQIEELKNEILGKAGNASNEELNQLLNEMVNLAQKDVKENIQEEISEKTEFLNNAKNNVAYGESNLIRTVNVLKKALRDLQYKMSEYYVENLSKFSIFKFWGTTSIRNPKRMVKPGFRAVNTGYKVVFTDSNGEETTMKFEAQGKGGLDYEDAEFSALGAEYHEAQKTKDGIISKNIEMPDFTIIGNDLTNKIEKEIRTKYSDVTTIEDFEELGMDSLVNQIKEYEQRISKEIQEKGGANNLTKKEIRKKVMQAFALAKESCIQKEIEDKINICIDKMADSESFDNKIAKNQENKAIYDEERAKIQKNNADYSEEEINHMAKVRVLYRLKEKEIKQYASTSVPMFFRANLPKKVDEEISVYWFSTGESIYRFFVNRLNGLKDSNGKYRYEPKEQQKKALLKLTNLFEDEFNNFYTYDKKSNSFGVLSKSEDIENR